MNGAFSGLEVNVKELSSPVVHFGRAEEGVGWGSEGQQGTRREQVEGCEQHRGHGDRRPLYQRKCPCLISSSHVVSHSSHKTLHTQILDHVHLSASLFSILYCMSKVCVFSCSGQLQHQMLPSVPLAGAANWPLFSLVVGQTREVICVRMEQVQQPSRALRAAEDKCSLHDAKLHLLR